LSLGKGEKETMKETSGRRGVRRKVKIFHELEPQ